jgi:hypothetical protein
MPKLAIKSNVLMHSNKNRFVRIVPTRCKVRGYLGRMELPAKVILAWGEAIGGNIPLRTWLSENGYPELALFVHALHNQREARHWLMENGHPHLMAIVRGAEGEEAAVTWLRLHGMPFAADIALAADNDKVFVVGPEASRPFGHYRNATEPDAAPNPVLQLAPSRSQYRRNALLASGLRDYELLHNKFLIS